MKIAAFLGSPRKDGNTELLLKEAVRGAVEESAEVETFRLNIMKIKPCQNCGGCDETGICTVEDDMGKIYDAIRTSSGIVLASPIFFSALSAQSKIMIDRCQAFWCEKYLLKKPLPGERRGLLILVGGQKKDTGMKCAEVTADIFYKTISVSGFDTLGFRGVDAKGAIGEHPTALRDAYEAGKRLAAQLKKSGK